MQGAEIVRAVRILEREGWSADKILAFILEVSGDTPGDRPEYPREPQEK